MHARMTPCLPINCGADLANGLCMQDYPHPYPRNFPASKLSHNNAKDKYRSEGKEGRKINIKK